MESSEKRVEESASKRTAQQQAERRAEALLDAQSK